MLYDSIIGSRAEVGELRRVLVEHANAQAGQWKYRVHWLPRHGECLISRVGFARAPELKEVLREMLFHELHVEACLLSPHTLFQPR